MKLHSLTDFLSLRDNRLFYAALLIAVLPLWLTPYVPLVDAPQHAAQVASLHEILRGNPLFTTSFEINWFTPYLIGYAALYLASLVLPIVPATKLVLSLAIVGFPLMTGAVLREIGADDRLKWLAIPGAFSIGLYWGFLVYVVALPIALGLLVLTVRFERAPTVRMGIGVAAFALMLFFGHVIALGFAALISLAYLLARNLKTLRRLPLLMLPYTAPLPLMAIWMTRVLDTEVAVQQAPTIFGGLRAHLTTLFTQLSGLDESRVIVGFIIVATTMLLPFIAGYRPSRKLERWLPFVVGLGVYFAFPSYWQNTAFLFQRLAVFIVPLWLIVWEQRSKAEPVFGIAVLASFALWCSVNLERFSNFGGSIADFDTVLSAAEPGRRLASLPLCNASAEFYNPVLLHFGAWYQAERAGIADMSFATTHPSLVRYRDMAQRRVGDFVSWNPARFDWERDAGDTYDYYLVCAGFDAAQLIFKDHERSVELVESQGPWWLYKNVARFSDEMSVALPEAAAQD